jgi:hypothetical protein
VLHCCHRPVADQPVSQADSRTQGKAVDPLITPPPPPAPSLLQVYAFCLNCSPPAPAIRMHARAAGGTWRGVLIAQPATLHNKVGSPRWCAQGGADWTRRQPPYHTDDMGRDADTKHNRHLA